MSGSATFTAEMSRITISWATASSNKSERDGVIGAVPSKSDSSVWTMKPDSGV